MFFISKFDCIVYNMRSCFCVLALRLFVQVKLERLGYLEVGKSVLDQVHFFTINNLARSEVRSHV